MKKLIKIALSAALLFSMSSMALEPASGLHLPGMLPDCTPNCPTFFPHPGLVVTPEPQ